MNNNYRTERLKQSALAAKKQLDTGTWPEVVMVFSYPTPRAPRATDADFTTLKTSLLQAQLPNLCIFVYHLQFAEKEHGVSLSYKFSLRRRAVPGIVPDPVLTDDKLSGSLPGLLVGSYGGIEGAVGWLNTLINSLVITPPELMQVLDKVFGEANKFLQGPAKKMSVSDILTRIHSNDAAGLRATDTPTN